MSSVALLLVGRLKRRTLHLHFSTLVFNRCISAFIDSARPPQPLSQAFDFFHHIQHQRGTSEVDAQVLLYAPCFLGAYQTFPVKAQYCCSHCCSVGSTIPSSTSSMMYSVCTEQAVLSSSMVNVQLSLSINPFSVCDDFVDMFIPPAYYVG